MFFFFNIYFFVPTAQDTIELLKQRVSDAKSSVRKAALEVMAWLS